MLWREPYATRVLEQEWPELELLDAKGSPLAPRRRWALVGSFNARATRQREVWRRLFEAELRLPYHLTLVGHKPGSTEANLWLGSMPRSQQEIAAFLPDVDQLWRSAIAQEHEGCAFAMLLKDARPDLVMVGPPTEDAWEMFLQIGSSD